MPAAFPPGMTLASVTVGPVLGSDGKPVVGQRIVLTPEWELIHAPSFSRLLRTDAVIVTGPDGTGSVTIPRSDTPGLTRPNPRYWVAWEQNRSADRLPEPGWLYANADVVDLEQAQPTSGSGGTAVQPTVSVAGLVGAITAAGLADALVEALAPHLSNPADPLGTAGRAALASSGLPADAIAAGAITQRYNPAASTYGCSSARFRKSRAKAAKARTGKGLLRVGLRGDSTVASHPAAGNVRGRDDVGTRLLKVLETAGFPVAGTGMVPTSQASTTNPDPRWTFTGTWADAALFRESGGSGATATFTSDRPGTVVEIKVYAYKNASWSYSIDGAAAVTQTATVTNQVETITVTGLTDAVHTVVITQTGSVGLPLMGACVRRASGLLVSNFGVGGSTSNEWKDAGYAGNRVAAKEPLDLDVLNIGINDYFTSMPLATFEANLTAALGLFTSTADRLLLIGNPVSATVTPARSEYTRVAYKVAEALAVPVLDLCDRWGTYAEASAAGLVYSDGTHPVPEGNDEIAAAIARGAILV